MDTKMSRTLRARVRYEQPLDNIKHPIFKAEIEPDIRFLGFELTKKVAKGSSNPAG